MSGCSFNEGWHVGDSFRRHDSDFQELDPVDMDGEIVRCAVEEYEYESWRRGLPEIVLHLQITESLCC